MSFQIHKKRRIIGRVQCKNIKTQCPKVTCSDPILLPGRCCKVCPGSEDESKFIKKVQFEKDIVLIFYLKIKIIVQFKKF